MTVRTTFALDPATGSAIARLAKLWKASKPEAVRRSIAEAERQAAAAIATSPLEALDWLQSHGTLTESAAARWKKDNRKGWEEASLKKGASIYDNQSVRLARQGGRCLFRQCDHGRLWNHH